jgi:hypothetical protein
LIHNYFSNKEKILNIKNRLNFLAGKDICINYSNILNNLQKDEVEKIKKELIAEISEKFEDDENCNLLEEKILNTMNFKLEGIFTSYEKKLDEYINNFAKTIDKTIHEERLLSLRLEKLIQFYKY